MAIPIHPDTHTRRGAQQRYLVALAVLFQVLVPLLPNIGLGQSIGARSAMVNTLVTPADWAFAIWGPLYFGTAVFALFQVLPKQTDNPLLARLGWLPLGAFLGNGAWALYVQLAGMGAISAAIIVATLLCLLGMSYIMAGWMDRFSKPEQWCVVLPLSALAGWLTAATIANIAATLKYYGVEAPGLAPTIAGVLVAGAGLVVALAQWRSRGNPWFALVFIWALVAIHQDGGQREAIVAQAAILAAILVALATLWRLLLRVNRRHWLEARRGRGL